MSNVIQFLENAGSRTLSAAEFSAGLKALDADAPQKRALATGDSELLNELLGGRKKLLFAVLAADEDC